MPHLVKPISSSSFFFSFLKIKLNSPIIVILFFTPPPPPPTLAPTQISTGTVFKKEWAHTRTNYSCVCVMVLWSGQRTAGRWRQLVKNGDHSRRMAAIRFYVLSRRQFSAHPKSSRSRIDKRTARATGNTRYRYSKIGPLDHKMADNCVSLARTNTVSSTITKPIKT